MSNELYLEDLEVGQSYESGRLIVQEADILRFAREFDPQPFHLDDEAARKTLFGGLAASGWHTAALTMRLLVDGGIPLANGIIGAGGEISWPRPVRPGDELHVVSTVIEITPSASRPDRARVRLASETRTSKGEVVQTFTSTLIVFRKSTQTRTDPGKS